MNQKITQIALIVDDIQAYAERYAVLWDTAVPNIIITDGEEIAHTRYLGQPTAARAKLAFFHLDNITVELIEPIGGPSVWQEFLDRHGPGVHHIAFAVNGMQTAVAGFEQNGLSLTQTGDFTGGRYAYLASAQQFGVDIELLEFDRA